MGGEKNEGWGNDVKPKMGTNCDGREGSKSRSRRKRKTREGEEKNRLCCKAITKPCPIRRDSKEK
jgi:hypothetical protein